jgi:hypothetical protein
VKRCSRVIYDPSDLTGHNNRYNIDYIISGSTDAETQDARFFFSNLLTSELCLRGLPVIGSIDERQARLKELLKVEQQLDIISKAISRGEEGKEVALMLISQAIPCIMHLKNRVSEKKITVLLAMAADNFQSQKTTTTTLTTGFASRIPMLVNTQILESVLRPKQWKLPLNLKGDSVCKVSLTNNKAWLFVDNIDALVNRVFSAPQHKQRKQIWLQLITNYRNAIRILWKRSAYTEDDICEFQLKINDFFVAHVEESGAGKEGVTNYIHMLGSGHVAYYMKAHGNLYKFSQQGWESLNEKFKLSFF